MTKNTASDFTFLTNFQEVAWGRIFHHVRPSYEQVVSDLDRSMNISLWVLVAHSSFTERLHTTYNTASGFKPLNIGPWASQENDLFVKLKIGPTRAFSNLLQKGFIELALELKDLQ